MPGRVGPNCQFQRTKIIVVKSRMSELRYLNLYSTQIGDEGLRPLTGIMKDLEMLDLRDTQITDDTLKRVQGLHKLTSLH